MKQARQPDNKYISRYCRQKRNRLGGKPADSPPTLADALRIRVHLLVIHNRQWTIEIFCNTCMSPWPIHHVPHHVHQKDLSWLYDIYYHMQLLYNYDKLIHIRISFLMLVVTLASGIQFKRWQTNTCLYFTGWYLIQGLSSKRQDVKSREVSKPRDWVLEYFRRSEIGLAPLQHCCRRTYIRISERSAHPELITRGFETWW